MPNVKQKKTCRLFNTFNFVFEIKLYMFSMCIRHEFETSKYFRALFC